jgi:hypothetical protein
MPSPARSRLKDATESTPTLDDYRRPGWTATSFLGVGIFTTWARLRWCRAAVLEAGPGRQRGAVASSPTSLKLQTAAPMGRLSAAALWKMSDARRVRPANAITDSDAGRVPGERCLPQCRPRRLSNTGSPSGSVPPLRGLKICADSRDDRPDAVSSPAIFGSNRSRMRKDVRRPGGHNDRPPPRRRAARWGSSPS